jgi:DNA-binding transcriptional regulator of glucitol operon
VLKTLGITLSLLALLALVAAIAMLCHGFVARAQMKRYQQIHADTPTKRKAANGL